MATYFARKAGNVNDVDVWATTPAGVAGDYFGSFTASDVLVSNNFIVNLNVSTTVQEIRNGIFEGSTAGGSFNVTANITLTADVVGMTVSGVLQCTTDNITLILNGNITGGTSSSSIYGVNWTASNANITINGSLTAGPSASIGGQHAFSMSSSANSTVLINGNITGTSRGGGFIAIGSCTNLNLTINGDLTTVTGVNSGSAVSIASQATSPIINITGNITGGGGAGIGLTLQGEDANLVVTGNINGGSTTGYGISIASANSTTTINGNLIGGSSASGFGVYFNIASSTSAVITINGDITGGSSGAGLDVTSTCTNLAIDIEGNITGGTGGDGATIASSSGNTTISGNITGSITSTGNGLNYSGVGTLVVTGFAKGGNTAATSIGLNITGASGGDINLPKAIGGSGVAGGPGVSCVSTRVCYIEEAEYGDLGASPTNGTIRFSDVTNNKILMYRYLSSKKTLYATAGVNAPATSDVRSGVTYSSGTGTLAMPAPSNVLQGVPTDNTVGTLEALSPGNIWDVLTSTLTTSGSIGERLKNCSTITSVGQQLTNALTKVPKYGYASLTGSSTLSATGTVTP